MYCYLIINNYSRGNALQRRLKEREKENEADERDRQREREELEELKQKLLEEGHPDPEAEIAKVGILTVIKSYLSTIVQTKSDSV